MQTAGDFVGAFIKLTTSVEHCHHDLQRAHPLFFVDIHRDTATIVLHNDRVVFTDRHLDAGAVACQSLVNRVVHCFVDQVVQTFFADVANVHGRALANGFKPFEHLDI